jgi:hypothetical protein
MGAPPHLVGRRVVSPDGVARRELERRIELRRAELGSAVRLLRESAVENLSPAERFRREPYPFVAAALGLGLLIALRHAARERT